MRRPLIYILLVAILGGSLFFYSRILHAHPGNTASDGCHYCRTNCDYWGVPWNVRHCHNSSVEETKLVITTKTETKKVVIPFEKRTEDDTTLEVGETKQKQKGVNGERTIKYLITLTDGIETSRKKTSDTVTRKPVTEITLKGTKPKSKQGPEEKLTEENVDDKEVKGNVKVDDAVAGAVAGAGLFSLILGIVAVWVIIKALKK